jgi:putative ABC transport system permease protein
VLLLAATLLEGATNPWRALFAQSRGADIWLRLNAGTSVRPLRDLGGVTELAGPYQTTAATMVRGPLSAPVQVWALGQQPPAVGRPLLREGHWLTAAQPSGVVVEASFAQAVRVRVGSPLVIEGLDGSSVSVRVAGIADTSVQGFYPGQTPGLMWVLPGLIGRVEPVHRHTEELVGLRLVTRGATRFLVL